MIEPKYRLRLDLRVLDHLGIKLYSNAAAVLSEAVANGLALDIRFRMLQPHELAAAMGFPTSYVFTGNKGDTIRQIGNAVCCEMARALVGAMLDASRPKATRTEAVA